jgi:hypothetical protein
MVVFIVKIKCDLENMKNIRLNSSAILQFDISSPSGEIRKGITVNPFDDIELTGSKGILKSYINCYIKFI